MGVQDYSVAMAVDAITGKDIPRHQISREVATNADGLAVQTGGVTQTSNNQLLFNGTTYDRQRNNVESSPIASAARTATNNSATQVNFNHTGVQFFLDVTVASGTGGLQLFLRGRDPASGKMIQLNTPPTAITAVGTYVFEFRPGATAFNDTTRLSVSIQLPRQFDVQVVHGDATSYTYSVGQVLLV